MKRGIILLFTCFVLRFMGSACGWDWDTIQMEKREFPEIHELIAGKFLRHSQAFYYWRIKDRTLDLETYPDSLALYDDLAWAHDKIGDHETAIKIMLEKEAKSPGLYETYANLGTSYIHNREFEKGLEYIEKAIEINPEAHFGREIYQKFVVEYIISKQDSTGNFSLPLSTGDEPDFYNFLKDGISLMMRTGSTRSAEIAKAVKGIAGMMKFGNYDSPVLLECLGDLLYAANSGVDPGAGHLASRAYLKAALGIKDKAISDIYREKARQSLERQWSPHEMRRDGNDEVRLEHPVYSLKKLEQLLKVEIQSANIWFEEIEAQELKWIEAKVNVDSAFAAVYYEAPEQKILNQYNKMEAKPGQEVDPTRHVDEEYWLNHQLENPENITGIHDHRTLSDSLKQAIDALYAEEFAQFNAEPEVADSSSTEQVEEPAKKEKKEDEKEFPWNLVLAVMGVGIGLTVYALMKRRNSN